MLMTQTTTAAEDHGARAETLRGQAAEKRETASRLREEAQADLAEAEREAAGIIAAARDRGVARGADATAADREAAALEETAGYHAEADRRQHLAAEALQRAEALAAEREHLAGDLAEVGGKLADVEEKRRQLAGQHDTAVEAADVDAIAEVRARLDAADEARAALSGRRQALAGRLEAIGDGQEHGELYDALSTAQQHERAVRAALNAADPERPEAVEDRLWGDVRAALAGNLERIADERRAAQQPQRPNVIHL